MEHSEKIQLITWSTGLTVASILSLLAIIANRAKDIKASTKEILAQAVAQAVWQNKIQTQTDTVISALEDHEVSDSLRYAEIIAHGDKLMENHKKDDDKTHGEIDNKLAVAFGKIERRTNKIVAMEEKILALQQQSASQRRAHVSMETAPITPYRTKE